MTHNFKNKEEHLIEKYVPIIKMVVRQYHRGGVDNDFLKTLEEINYTMFTKRKDINNITYNPKNCYFSRKKGSKCKNKPFKSS